MSRATARGGGGPVRRAREPRSVWRKGEGKKIDGGKAGKRTEGRGESIIYTQALQREKKDFGDAGRPPYKVCSLSKKKGLREVLSPLKRKRYRDPNKGGFRDGDPSGLVDSFGKV